MGSWFWENESGRLFEQPCVKSHPADHLTTSGHDTISDHVQISSWQPHLAVVLVALLPCCDFQAAPGVTSVNEHCELGRPHRQAPKDEHSKHLILYGQVFFSH
jgi:hypothetical protein